MSCWSSIIAVAAQRAFASSLLEFPLDTVASAAGEPAVHEIIRGALVSRPCPQPTPRERIGPRRGVDPGARVVCICTGTVFVPAAISVRKKHE